MNASNNAKKVRFDFEIKLKGPNAAKFEDEAHRRGLSPLNLMADLLDTVIEDNLYVAILDK